MTEYYIQAPQMFQQIRIYKGNAVEMPDPNDVPRGYEKVKYGKIKSILCELEWALRHIRKGNNYDN